MNPAEMPPALNPFPTPLWLQNSGGFEVVKILPAIFALVFIIWSAYTIIVVYHWFRYSHRSWLTVPALALHFFISITLLLFTISGLQ